MIRLILRQRGEERQVEYAALPITLGRNPDTTIHVDEKMVSRLHARIEDTPQGVMLRDLDSVNGTCVNRIRVKEALLKPGDVVNIGDTEIIWIGMAPAQADVPPKPTVAPPVAEPTFPAVQHPMPAEEAKAAPAAANIPPVLPAHAHAPASDASPAEVERPAPPVIPFPIDDHMCRSAAAGAAHGLQKPMEAPQRLEALPPALPPAMQTSSPDARTQAASRQQSLLLWLEDIKRALYIVMAVGILVVVGFVAKEQFFSESDGDGKSGTRKSKTKSTSDDTTADGVGSDMAADLQREADVKRREREKHAAALAEAKRKAEDEERKQAAIMEEKRKAEEERLARIEEEKKRQEKEMAAAIEAEKVKVAPLYAAVGELVRKYSFDKAIAMCNSAREETLDVSLRAEITQRAQEIEALRAMFESMLQRMKAGKVVLELTDTVSVQIENADAEKWSGSTAGGAAKITQRWTDTKPRSVVSIFLSASPSPGELFCLGLFCYEHGLIEEAEEVLIDCHKKDSERKPAIDQLIARARQMAVPEGGFLLYKGSWVTAEEKSYLERGYVKYDGKWMTEDEMMTAKGFVKHEGRWISQEEKEKIEKREAELAALKLKLQPKGLIDKPGADTESIPWAKAQEIKTANYRIKSNLSPEALKDCAYTMEVLHLNFKKIFGLEQRKMMTFRVNVARTAAEYHTSLGGPQGALGHCSPEGEICAFYLPGTDGLNTTSVLMHEGTHQFVFRISPNAPTWMHEGMATYFECSKFDGRDLMIGLKNKHRLATIRANIENGSYCPLADFIADKGGDPYSQGWSLVYYLVHAHNGMYSRMFDRYLSKVGSQMEPKYFMKAFGVKDLDAFEEDWKAFVLGLSLDDAEDMPDKHK